MPNWAGGQRRRAADLYEENYGTIFAALAREAGKSLPDSVGELREAVDFLRYYANEGEAQTQAPRGIFTAISPWTFPLAIFTGQLAAAPTPATGPVWSCCTPMPPLPAAVLAQEAWEAICKSNPVNLLRTRLSRTARIEMEVTGHEVEVQAAFLICDRDADDYRAAEAGRMKRGYDGLFDTVTRVALRAAREARGLEARRWVRQHRDRLEEWT